MRSVGIEIELLAPRGMSRLDMAHACAAAIGGTIEPFFHPLAEPSLAEGIPVFETLTRGLRVRKDGGSPFADFVDDVTIQADLERTMPAPPDWHRIACDDARLSRLIARICDPRADLPAVLDPAASLLAGKVLARNGLYQLVDQAGAPVAIAAAQPGERQRVCEIVTRPMNSADLPDEIDAHLARARALSFAAPTEGAIHLHFDGADLRSAPALQALIRLFHERRTALLADCRPNPNCRRIGPWSPEFVATALEPSFAALDWDTARRRLMAAGATKFCDFNILNILVGRPEKTTFEIRTLPVAFDAETIVRHIARFAALVDEALEGTCRQVAA